MTPAPPLLAVQISNPDAHPLMPGRSGLWGIAFLAVALTLTVHGMVRLLRARQWRTRALAAEARIVDNAPHMTGLRRTLWQPIIEFDALGAHVHTAVSSIELRHALPLGGTLGVLYDPREPAQVRVADAQMVG